ncbi:MAG: thiamine-phosphate kinase [Frankiales bacterium]|nr:thiamine-phosphate kinase [Frankiales bacterium]
MTTVREAGEAGLIRAVAARLAGDGPAVEVGNGDDAAVLRTPDGRVVATVDLLVEHTHFRRDWSTAYDVGRRAAAANLADVASMGAVGTALLVGLAAPGDLPLQWAVDLADGLRDEAALVGALVVGGDSVAGPSLVISVTALGDLQGRPAVRRSGARPADVVVLAGRLGHAAAGLALLSAGETGPLVAAHQRPVVPYGFGPAVAELGATSMCDVSDGLVVDAASLGDASGVAVDLRGVRDDPDVRECWERLVGPAGPGPIGWTLHGGEDHALLATVPPEALDRVLGLGAVEIGRVTAGTGVLLDGRPVEPGNWRHWA